ncbi:serine hydrolase [Paenibacillus sp. FJAT-26967]|uniref:serine hydrolase domain-containing protein n=1 Tax=Paenibacillus sp. FJAT-26967 TaxID=1729690 RepID=UPI0020A2DCB6|nr:serine hydrolase domain-containing protein [Paenibacillus sp. FJAT-26967]
MELDMLCTKMNLDAVRIRSALQLLDKEVEEGNIPGAVIAIGRQGHLLEYVTGKAMDNQVSKHGDLPAAADTLYDTASLTKVVVTLPLILFLLEEGKLRLDDKLSLFFEEFKEGVKADINVRHLLTHTAGFVSAPDMYSHGWTREEIIQFVLRQQPVTAPGTKVEYSDVGYIILGHLIERLFGQPLEQLAYSRIFSPLGMTDSMFCPPEEIRDRIAATEHYANEDEPRWGVVHDENAYVMGGIGGHAGLFSTARDLHRYAQLWLEDGVFDGHRLLSKASLRASIYNLTPGTLGGSRGLGWALKGDKLDASGDLLSAATYGHTGYTGTSLYVDPESKLTIVLLTNRVHYGRTKSVVRLRALIHNCIASAVLD